MKKKLKNINDSFLEENKYIFKKYKPIKKIGQGAFGNIYSTIRLKDKAVFAMKTEKNNLEKKSLESEAYYLFTLQGFGFPKLISYGLSKKYNILIETLLDKSLEDIFIKKNNKSNIIDICLIGIQIIDRLEWIHSKNIIYRDVKPENFLIGINDPNIIYIIDFGLCKKYRSSKTGKHILPKMTGRFNGNFKFASPNVIRGKESSRRDDLISLGYMLIYLFRKKLPWDESFYYSNFYELLYLKDTNANGKLFKNVPPEFVEYIKYTRNLKFDQDPNYDYLRSLLNGVIINLNFGCKKFSLSWVNSPFGLQRSNSKKRTSPQFRLYRKIKNLQNKRLKSVPLNDIHLENELKHCNIDKDNSLERSTIINEDKIKIANSSAKNQLKSINSLNNINAFKNEKSYANKYQTISEENLMIKNTIQSINHLYQKNLKTNFLLDNRNSNSNNKDNLIINKVNNIYSNNLKLNNFSSNCTINHNSENNHNSINYKDSTIESYSPYYELSENKIKLNYYLNNNGKFVNCFKNNIKINNRLKKKMQSRNSISDNINKKNMILKNNIPFKRNKNIDIKYKDQFNSNRIPSSTQQKKEFILSNDIKYKTPFARKPIDKANIVSTPQESHNNKKKNYKNLLDYKNLKLFVVKRNIKKGTNKNNNKNKFNIILINNNKLLRKENSIKNINSIYYYNKRTNFVKNIENMNHNKNYSLNY